MAPLPTPFAFHLLFRGNQLLSKTLLTALILVLFSRTPWAGTGPEHLKRFLDDLKTLQAKFEQTVLDETRTEAEHSRGLLSLWRPGRFRWDYTEPYKQLIVADGKKIWIYDSDLEQVSSRSQEDALHGTPAQLLSDSTPFETSFEVVDLGDRQGMAWVELIPRDPESQFISILLAFKGNELRRMEMADQFGQTTRFRFHDIRRNPPLADDLFVFEPPEGSDILDQ